ncbi:MFS transporter [Candidatus Poribacteria bacterium]
MIKDDLEEFDAQVKRHFRRNFIVNAGDFAFYILGLNFVSILTILPAFARKLTSSNLVIGMIPAINVMGWRLPQIISARYVERLNRKMPFILIVGIGERITWLFLSLAVFMLAGSSPIWILLAFFIFYAIFCFSGGINTPAWLDMIAKIIPERRRGRFFGVSNFIGSGTGVVGALIAGHLLDKLSFPNNFATCFMLTFAATAISMVFLALTKEPSYPVVKERSSLKNYIGQLWTITRYNHNFLFFLVATVILSFGGMATGFFAVHAINKLDLSGGDIGRFTAISLVFQTITNPLWGYLGDRKGHRSVMVAGATGAILATLTAAFANSTSFFYVVFAITGISLSADAIARLSIVLEFSEPEERPTYIGLTNTIKAPFAISAPMLGGMLGDRFQLPFVFLLTSGVVFIGLFVLLLMVKEPRSQRQTLAE